MCGKPLLLLEMHEVVDPLEESILPIRMYSWIAGRCLVSACNGYVVHSRETREAVARAYGIDAAKIFVVPHGPYDNYSINATDTAKKDLNLGDGFTILNFGMLRRYKGISILVDAFGLLPAVIARKSWLVIAGEDWGDDPEIRPAIERSPFRDRIVFRAEFVPDEEVGVYFSAADVVVLPYQRTCGSGVANIALAQRKPIITTDLATMRECLDGYHGAEYFLVNDTTGLRNQILKAFERWERGENTLTPAAKTAATWERIVAGYERIVDDLRREK
jgi:glycosyltransferase involved in cell wall biosynthesis